MRMMLQRAAAFSKNRPFWGLGKTSDSEAFCLHVGSEQREWTNRFQASAQFGLWATPHL
jgi:hypothetical protein